MASEGTRGGTAVMARRAEAWDSLDCFPTPPWATRALTEWVLPRLGVSVRDSSVWEPAAGLGHMVQPLQEAGARVFASDVFEYGPWIDKRIDFVAMPPLGPNFDWVITNPPFNQAERFVERGCEVATTGVAFLCRLALLESKGRFHMFRGLTPSLVAVFSERVPMVKGRWDPSASSATAYAWFIWHGDSLARSNGLALPEFPLLLIPPDCRANLSRPSDRVLARRVAPGCETPAPLLGGA